MVRRILTLPRDKRFLRATCEEVTPGDFWAGVVNDLTDTLKATSNAVGLAAPQIGSLLRIFVVRDGPRILAFINPRILAHSEEAEVGSEECLSMPGVFVTVPRWSKIHVEVVNLEGPPVGARFSGALARAVQHERDHLDGILIGQREAEYVRTRRASEAPPPGPAGQAAH
jgi:peptide deformylase